MEEMALALLRCQKDTLIMIKDRERHSKSGRVIEGSNGRVAPVSEARPGKTGGSAWKEMQAIRRKKERIIVSKGGEDHGKVRSSNR